VRAPEDMGAHKPAEACDLAAQQQLQTDVMGLRSAIARLRYCESPLAIRGALFAVLYVRTSDAWTGAFEHLAGRRRRMRPLVDALDAHYEFRRVERPLDPDAVRAVASATASMAILPFAIDLFNALLAIGHQRDLVLRLTAGRRNVMDGASLTTEAWSWPPPAAYLAKEGD